MSRVTTLLRATAVAVLIASAAAVGALGALVGPVAAAAPAADGPVVSAVAGAGECERLDPTDPDEIRVRADAVDAVFVGKVRAVRSRTSIGGGEGKVNGSPGSPGDDPDRSIKRWQHTVVVDVSFRGDVRSGRRVAVVTEPKADEGLGRLRPGEVYLFFAEGTRGMDHMTVSACSGTARLPHGLGARLDRVLHQALDERQREETPEVALAAPAEGTHEAPSYTRLAAPGVAIALVGVLGLLLLTRVGRQH